jgi:hypothetical protein
VHELSREDADLEQLRAMQELGKVGELLVKFLSHAWSLADQTSDSDRVPEDPRGFRPARLGQVRRVEGLFA